MSEQKAILSRARIAIIGVVAFSVAAIGPLDIFLPVADIAHAQGAGSGGGNGNGNGSGNGNSSSGGNGNGDGGGNGNGSGAGNGNSTGAGNGSGKGHANGHQPGHQADGAAAGRSLTHDNGMRETLQGGRYEMRDAEGRVIINRDANVLDYMRLGF